MTAGVDHFAPGDRVFVHADPDAPAPVALAGVRGIIVAVRGDYAVVASASASETLEIALSHLCHDRRRATRETTWPSVARAEAEALTG